MSQEPALTEANEHVEPDKPEVVAGPTTRAERNAPIDNPLLVAALTSGAAGVLHAAAVGMHTDHRTLSLIFVALATMQLAVAVGGLMWPNRVTRAALILVNGMAVAGWVYTHVAGVSFIPGLESRESFGVADTIAAVLALVAVVTAARAPQRRRTVAASRRWVTSFAAVATMVLLVPGLVAASNHQHDAGHTDDHHADDVSGQNSDAAAATSTPTDTSAHHHDHGSDSAVDAGSATTTSEDQTDAATTANVWPRPWDPTQPIDFSGVPDVTPEEQARAEQLVRNTLTDLPGFADVDTIAALGYSSIGDSSTGYEHFVNLALIDDGKFLDPQAPESLVYEVDGDKRTLVSAMFISPATTLDDPKLTDYAGPLMQWHVHDNLCWGVSDDGRPVVKSVLNTAGETCPSGTFNPGGYNPMVHVWIAPNACGPFAALEGAGAGQADAATGDRTDMCSHDHAHMGGTADTDTMDMSTMDMGTMDMSTASAGAYDPSLPIDLSGVPGVTPQQQAYAENLVSANIVELPKWADLTVVEAAGFKSIGDGVTGHEHYIQWDWINDDVFLDPNHPESLVFEPQPDGSKKLVSAMYMLPEDTALDEVPDLGGALMQWHIHGDLCFTNDPVAPVVAGGKPIGGQCPHPLVNGPLAPMIHVWIVPQECGPFAALEGIGGGQVPEGEEVSCLSTHQHG